MSQMTIEHNVDLLIFPYWAMNARHQTLPTNKADVLMHATLGHSFIIPRSYENLWLLAAIS